MAIGRTLVLLAGVLAGAHSLQEQIKLEREFGQASTCKAADLTTDWGTAVKYLAVTPSNRSITERDFYSMTRQFICTIDEAITKARDAAGDKIKIQQAATELSLAVTQGVLAVCSLITFLLTIACCNAKKGPVLLSLAGLPNSGQSLHVPPVLESGPPPLPGLAADPWSQPDRHNLSSSQAASQLAHSNQIRVAHLASLQNISAPAPAPSPAPAPASALAQQDRDLFNTPGTLQHEVYQWVSGGDPDVSVLHPALAAAGANLARRSVIHTANHSPTLAVPQPTSCSVTAPPGVPAPFPAPSPSLPGVPTAVAPAGAAAVPFPPLNWAAAFPLPPSMAAPPPDSAIRERITLVTPGVQGGVYPLSCSTQFSWQCEVPTIANGTATPCPRHDRAEEWNQVVGPHQVALTLGEAVVSPTDPTFRDFMEAVQYLESKDKVFQEYWCHPSKRGSPSQDSAAPSPAKRPRLSRASSSQSLHSQPGAAGGASESGSNSSSIQWARERCLEYPYQPMPEPRKHEYMEFSDPIPAKLELDQNARPSSAAGSAVSDNHIPSLTGSEASSCTELMLVHKENIETHLAQCKAEEGEAATNQAANNKTELIFTLENETTVSQAGSEYGPGRAENNMPDIDAINRQNISGNK